MSALDEILQHITTCRSLGAQSIQFTVSASIAAGLQSELSPRAIHGNGKTGHDKLRDHERNKPVRKERRKSRLLASRARQPDHAVPPVMHIDGCPIFVGEGDGISFSWKK